MVRTLPYVPRLLRGRDPWDLQHPVEGLLASVDVSGFTALSERLAEQGREGAEELTRLLTEVFSGMVIDAESAGGDVLAFGGDAMLVLFPRKDRPLETTARTAVDAVRRMTSRVEAPLRSPLAGRVQLRTSAGLHTGTFHLAVPDVGHRQLIVFGPDVSACLRAEALAAAGQTRATAALAGLLEPAYLDAVDPDGATIADRPLPATMPPPADASDEVSADPAVFLPPGLVAEVAAGTTLGEHRRVSIGFVSITGIDAVVRRDGPDVGAAELAVVAQGVAEAVSRTGVHVLASDAAEDGVKLILAAGAPTSVGDDEAALIGTLTAALAAPTRLQVKAGAHRGPVYVGDLGGASRRTLTVMGDAVNLAARLMQAAGPGQLLASNALLERASVGFETEPLPPFAVKGKREAIEACVVGARIGVRSADGSEGAGIVGRETQLAEFEAVLDALRAGTGATIALVGDPGSGRSRVLQEAVALAAGCQVALEVATRDERGAARGPVTRLLRRVCGLTVGASAEVAGAVLIPRLQAEAPELLPLAPLLNVPLDLALAATPESSAIDERFRTERSLDHLIAVLQAFLDGPTVFALDGLHHADDASRRTLRALAAGALRGPWAVFLSHPPGDELAIDGARTISLPPLPDERIRTLVVGATAATPLHDHDLERVVSRASGNPMFALELARAAALGEDDLSDSIETLATARIDRLPPISRALVRDVAVIGTEAPRSLIGQVLGPASVTEPILSPAAEVLIGDASTLRFRHALYQQVAYASTSFSRRRELHASIAAALEGPATVDDPRTSFHLARAGDHAGAWTAAVSAARAARSRGAAADAYELYQRALQAATNLEAAPDDLAAVAESAGDQAEQASRYPAAREAYELAGRHVGDVLSIARLGRKQGELEERQGRYEAAMTAYNVAADLLEGATDRGSLTELAQIGLAAAGVRHRQGDHLRFHAAAQRAADAAQAAGALRALAHARYLLGHAASFLGRDGTEHMQAALVAFEELHDRLGGANVHNNLGVQAYFGGRWDDAAGHYEQALKERQLAGDVVGAAMQINNLAEIDADRGHWELANGRFDEALRTWSAVRYPAGAGLARSNLGRTAARLAAAAGDADGLGAAARRLTAARDELDAIGATGFADDVRCRLAEVLLLDHRPVEAEAALGEVTTIERDGPQVVGLATLLRLQALALAQRGSLAEAESISETARATAQASQARYELALATIGHAHIRRAAGASGADVDQLLGAATSMLLALGVVTAVVPTVDPQARAVVTIGP